MVLPLKGLQENLPPSLCYWRNVWIPFLPCQWEWGSWATAGKRVSGGLLGWIRHGRKLYPHGIISLGFQSPISFNSVLKRCNWGQKQSQCPEFLFFGGAGSGVPSGQEQPTSASCVGSHGNVDKCMRAPKTRNQVQASRRGQKINFFVKKKKYLLTSHTCICLHSHGIPHMMD